MLLVVSKSLNFRQELTSLIIHPDFYSIKWLIIFLLQPPWMGCWSITGLAPALNFNTPWCFAQKHNAITLARVQAETTQLDSSMLHVTTRSHHPPSHLSLANMILLFSVKVQTFRSNLNTSNFYSEILL